ncbi:MAG: hypothetical protein Q8P56_04245 [Candidatus Uhrbacteria bacterium]|nr:hypothetical protein [Candidatus Uhrbacteria bacterium]
MPKKVKKILYAVAFIGFISIAFWLSEETSKNELIQNIISRYGYLGALVASIISGLNLIVPIPAITFLPALVEAGLNFWLTIAVISLGMTIGDMVGYAIGHTGRHLVSPPTIVKAMNQLEHIKNKYRVNPVAALFIYASVVPFPNEAIVIPLGFLGYRFKQLAPAALAGNLVFNCLSAFGLINLFRLF